MREHVGPLLLDLAAEGRSVDRRSRWHFDSGVRALPREHRRHRRRLVEEVGVTVDMDDVVEVSRRHRSASARSFSASSSTSEYETTPRCGADRCTGWTMVRRTGRSTEHLVTRDVDLDLRERRRRIRARGTRSALTLSGCRDGSSDARTIARRGRARCRSPPAAIRRSVRRSAATLGFLRAAVDDGEVEILGEAVRLEVALPEAGPALEDPGLAKLGIGSRSPHSSQPRT